MVPSVVIGGVSRSEIVGDWEWLGNSFLQTTNYRGLLRTGPSINRFYEDGKYEYIGVFRGKKADSAVGNWKYEKDILSITRPDNGTFNYKILSYENGVLETQDTYLESYQYMKKVE